MTQDGKEQLIEHIRKEYLAEHGHPMGDRQAALAECAVEIILKQKATKRERAIQEINSRHPNATALTMEEILDLIEDL